MNKKIFILYNTVNEENAYIIANKISSYFDLDIATKFITNKDSIDALKFDYMDIEDIILAFKNNALLYCYSNDDFTECITLDEYYNKDIFPMKIFNFIDIPDNKVEDAIIIWLDNELDECINNTEINDSKYLDELLESKKYLYYNNCENIEEIIENIIRKIEIYN